jgi:para-nitrobenzyl esterase
VAVAEAAFAGTGRGPADVIEAYRRNAPSGSEIDGRTRFLTDVLFRVPAIRLADAARAHTTGVRMYLLTWGSPPHGRGLGAFHGLDLPFVWNRTDTATTPAAELVGHPLPAGLAAAVHGAWVEFATTGVPRHPRLPEWPGYDPARRATMLLDDTSRVVDDPLGDERRLWAGVRY